MSGNWWWLLLPVALLLLPSLFQDRMVYFPRAYEPGMAVPAPLTRLRYRTGQGEQSAFWWPPAAGEARRVWLVFGGNASLALDWLPVLAALSDARDGFLLLDYPGFGDNEGRPSAAASQEGAEAAWAALARHLAVPPVALERRLALLGHSIGAAAALRFAQGHRPQRLVLVSPFTSLRAVAQYHYGAWVGPLVRNDYDNGAALAALAGTPAVLIHGSADEVVPVAMGRELAQAHARLRYVEIPGARHNDIFDRGGSALREALAGPP